jgi:hypothetical protein
MGKSAKFASGAGCLVSVLGPLIALVLYPRAAWLFAFALIGVAVVVLSHLLEKDPPPAEVAESAERLLSGMFGGWDVDDYEHLNPHDPQLRELWRRTMEIGGTPEEWMRLGEPRKGELRNIIGKMRTLPRPSS